MLYIQFFEVRFSFCPLILSRIGYISDKSIRVVIE